MSDEKKKVIFILPALTAGGAERVLITLMNNLDRTRFEPEFISLQTGGPLKELIAKDVFIHKIGNHKNFFLGLIPLFLKLQKVKPDIIVTTMAHMNFAAILMKPFLRKKPRVIVREAITPSFMLDTMKLGWLIKILYKLLYPHADLVISPAQRIIDEFDDLLGADLSHHRLLYNPVNIDLIRGESQIQDISDINRDKCVHFVCAGRLHPQKGFDQLIDALGFFKCNYDWRLTILGGGDEHDSLNNLIKKYGLQNKVTLYGFTKEPWPHIGAADCFLMPSRFEGLPNVVLESLCVGTPVIATRSSGGIEEIASVAKHGDVTIVDTMPQFIDAMKLVKPHPARVYRPSLLPETFETHKVMNHFMDLISGNSKPNISSFGNVINLDKSA